MKSKVQLKFDEKAAESVMIEAAQSVVAEKELEFQCPQCGQIIIAKPGKSICPKCGNEVELKVNFKF